MRCSTGNQIKSNQQVSEVVLHLWFNLTKNRKDVADQKSDQNEHALLPH